MNKYKSIKDKYESLFTVMIYDMKVNDLIDKLNDQLKKIQNINNKFKKKYLNDRLYNFILYLKENGAKNSIYLVHKEVEHIKLTKKKVKILREYGIKNYIFLFDNYFHIEYLKKLFTDFKFYDVIEFDRNSCSHYIINSTKRKVIKSIDCKDVINYVDKLNRKCLLHGTNTILKNLNINHYIFNKKLHKDDIINIFIKEEMKVNHIKLEKCLNMFTNEKELDKLVYGKIEKDIKEAIEYYKVKQLFVHKNIIDKVKSIASVDCFNFDLIEIDKIEDNDISDILLNQYNGVIGITYY
jgi:hypothetical protein